MMKPHVPALLKSFEDLRDALQSVVGNLEAHALAMAKSAVAAEEQLTCYADFAKRSAEAAEKLRVARAQTAVDSKVK